MSKLCIINSGHGRLQAPGKRSPILPFDHPLRERIMKEDRQKLFRYPEWFGNREITRHIMRMLPKEIKAIELIPDTENYGQFLTGRVVKGNKLKADLWLGIHSDAANNGETFVNAKGHHVFYASAKEEAELLNHHMQLMFPQRQNRGTHHNPSSQYPTPFHELHGTNCKGLISENFFYSDEEEVRFLLDNLEAIASAHCNFLIEWSKM